MLQSSLACPKCNSTQFMCNGKQANGITKRYICKNCRTQFNDNTAAKIYSDAEVIEENVRLQKKNQKMMDSNRIKNKSFREYARVENAIEEYSEQLVNIFSKYQLSDNVFIHNESDSRAVGIIQLSDVHFNEMIDLPHNKYDFLIASKRLMLLANSAKKYFSMHNISNILIALTGDLLNSDRRLDELLENATNRSKATFLSVDILQQFILDLNKEFNISVACITGNESRVGKDVGWIRDIASDNYDFVIFNCLKYLFQDSGINFISGDPSELVVEVAGQNLLMLHGHGAIGKDVEKSVQQIKGRYLSRGIVIDYVIYGHVHSARVSDTFSRSSSLCGSNDYSEKALNLAGRASQNLYVFHENGNRDGLKVDLQSTNNVPGYPIEKKLESYNSKSLSKTVKTHSIVKVVI